LHEGVLELTSDPSDVEHAVAAFGPFPGLRQSRDSSYSSETHITSQRHMAALIQVGR